MKNRFYFGINWFEEGCSGIGIHLIPCIEIRKNYSKAEYKYSIWSTWILFTIGVQI